MKKVTSTSTEQEFLFRVMSLSSSVNSLQANKDKLDYAYGIYFDLSRCGKWSKISYTSCLQKRL